MVFAVVLGGGVVMSDLVDEGGRLIILGIVHRNPVVPHASSIFISKCRE